MVNRFALCLLTGLLWIQAFGQTSRNANKGTAGLAAIDPALLEHAAEQIRAYGRFIAAEAVHGIPRNPARTRISGEEPFPFSQHVRPGGIKVDLANGGAVLQAAALLSGFLVTGDSSLLRQGTAYADWLVQAQLARGLWAQTYIVDPDGRTWVPWLDYVVRIQDGHQSEPFFLLLYAFQLTGNFQYRDAAVRNADLMLSIQNNNGSWPDECDLSLTPFQGAWTSQRGVRVGGSYNDGATTCSAMQMLHAWALTGDGKYLAKLGGIGQWIFDTRLGKGAVCGWCQQYDYYHQPIQARHFEMPAIEPRTFVRFVVPHAAWFYALTADERYAEILRQGYGWLKAVETPEGWAYQYLDDGTPVCGWQFRFLHYDAPQTWPPDSVMGGHAEWRRFTRTNMDLSAVEHLLNVIAAGKADSLRKLISGPENLQAACTAWRLTAGRRATDPAVCAKMARKWTPGDDRKQATNAIWDYIQFLFDVRVAKDEFSCQWLHDRVSGFNRFFSAEQPPASSWSSGLVHANWLEAPIPNLR